MYYISKTNYKLNRASYGSTGPACCCQF